MMTQDEIRSRREANKRAFPEVMQAITDQLDGSDGEMALNIGIRLMMKALGQLNEINPAAAVDVATRIATDLTALAVLFAVGVDEAEPGRPS